VNQVEVDCDAFYGTMIEPSISAMVNSNDHLVLREKDGRRFDDAED